jgi:hypothetical protein
MQFSPFDTARFPPAPIISLQISAPQQPPQMPPLSALIDTRSDFSLCPLQILIDIDVPESRSATMRGMWSQRHSTTLYFVDIHLPIGILPGIEITSVDESEQLFEQGEVILGRNVLNKLYLLLDGPNMQTALLDRRPLRF